MLLRNWYNNFAYMYLGTYTSAGYGAGYIYNKNLSGYQTNPSSSSTSLAFIAINDSAQSNLLFGSGTNAVTFDDYALQSIITTISKTNVSVSLTTSNYNSSTLKWSLPVSCDVTNTSSSSITIGEFGFTNGSFLLFREVLATPITVAAGQRINFKYNVELQFPG